MIELLEWTPQKVEILENVGNSRGSEDSDYNTCNVIYIQYKCKCIYMHMYICTIIMQ